VGAGRLTGFSDATAVADAKRAEVRTADTVFMIKPL